MWVCGVVDFDRAVPSGWLSFKPSISSDWGRKLSESDPVPADVAVNEVLTIGICSCLSGCKCNFQNKEYVHKTHIIAIPCITKSLVLGPLASCLVC